MFCEPEQIRWELLAAVLCWKYIAKSHFSFTDNVFVCQETTIFSVRALLSAISSKIPTQSYSSPNSPPYAEYQKTTSASVLCPVQPWSSCELQAGHQSLHWLWMWPHQTCSRFGVSPQWLLAPGQETHFWEVPGSEQWVQDPPGPVLSHAVFLDDNSLVTFIIS